MILPVVLGYGCGNWSRVLKETLIDGFQNRCWAGSKRAEGTRGWKELYNEKHHALVSFSSQMNISAE
jgi:hypothetical protein